MKALILVETGTGSDRCLVASRGMRLFTPILGCTPIAALCPALNPLWYNVSSYALRHRVGSLLRGTPMESEREYFDGQMEGGGRKAQTAGRG